MTWQIWTTRGQLVHMPESEAGAEQMLAQLAPQYAERGEGLILTERRSVARELVR